MSDANSNIIVNNNYVQYNRKYNLTLKQFMMIIGNNRNDDNMQVSNADDDNNDSYFVIMNFVEVTNDFQLNCHLHQHPPCWRLIINMLPKCFLGMSSKTCHHRCYNCYYNNINV